MDKPRAREFWVRQYSTDGGMYSDIRVMKPSDCELGESPPPGHDNLKYYEILHVIEYSAYDAAQNKIKELEAQCKKLVEALKQIAGTHKQFVCCDLEDAMMVAEETLNEYEKWKNKPNTR